MKKELTIEEIRRRYPNGTPVVHFVVPGQPDGDYYKTHGEVFLVHGIPSVYLEGLGIAKPLAGILPADNPGIFRVGHINDCLSIIFARDPQLMERGPHGEIRITCLEHGLSIEAFKDDAAIKGVQPLVIRHPVALPPEPEREDGPARVNVTFHGPAMDASVGAFRCSFTHTDIGAVYIDVTKNQDQKVLGTFSVRKSALIGLGGYFCAFQTCHIWGSKKLEAHPTASDDAGIGGPGV